MLSPLAGQRRPAARLQVEAKRRLQKCKSLGLPSPRPMTPVTCASDPVLISPHRKPRSRRRPIRHPLLPQSSPPSTLLGPPGSHGPVAAKRPVTCQLTSPLGQCWPEPFLRAPLTPHTPPSDLSSSHLLNTQR